MSLARRLAILAVTIVVLSFQAAAAFGQPSGWKFVDITLLSEQQPVFIVGGELPEGTPLPHEAELAVPAGLQLQWIGEVLGGDPSNDPTLQYDKTSANGMDIYRFTMTRARSAQVELLAPAAIVFDGTNYATSIAWTASEDEPELRISQRVPFGTQIITADPAASLASGDAGSAYYTKTLRDVKVGQLIDLSFTYAPPAPGTAAPAGATSSDTTAFVIIGIAFVAMLGLLALVMRRTFAQPADEPRSSTTRVAAEKEPAAARAEATEPPAAETTEAVGRAKKSILVPLIGGAAFLVIGVLVIGSVSSSVAVTGDRMTRDYGSTSACQFSTIPVTARDGVDLSAQATKILAAFEGMEGMGKVTLDTARSTVDVEWCESSQTEDSLRQALAATGLVDAGQTPAQSSAPPTATVDPAGQ